MLKLNKDPEVNAINKYNEAIDLCGKELDHGTRDLLVKVLKDEEGYLDKVEALLEQINQMGLQNFLFSIK